MIFGFVFSAFSALAIWMAGLLPSAGCGDTGFSALGIGWVGAFIDVTAITAGFGVIIAVESGLVGFRVALWVWHTVKI